MTYELTLLAGILYGIFITGSMRAANRHARNRRTITMPPCPCQHTTGTARKLAPAWPYDDGTGITWQAKRNPQPGPTPEPGWGTAA
jgi:hypothetical protein